MADDTSERPGRIDAWKPLLHSIGLRAEGAIDSVRARFEQRFRPDRRLHVVAYRGFGNAERCTLSGRVLTYREPPDSDPDTLWHTLQTSYRRFETDEVPGVRIVARLPAGLSPGGDASELEGTSDQEGYFTLDFATPEGVDGTTLSVTLSLPEHDDAVQDGPAEVILPGADARFGVISDIDDTLLVTQATSLLKMMRLTLLESSESRVAFPGVAAFYEALHDGTNPFFYVSSSPWNLYEFLQDFMRLKGIVSGPLLLRDFGLDEDKFIAGPHLEHKLEQIRRVMDRFPTLPFVLVGDSGQHDPEVYSRIVEAYPGRVLAVYIRDVSDAVRDRAVQDIAARLAGQDVDMLLVPDMLAAARHAASRGWLDESAPARVAEDVDRELAPHEAVDAQTDG